MTTGGEGVLGEKEGGGRGGEKNGERGGHRKMAVALSHLLSDPAVTESKVRGTVRKRIRDEKSSPRQKRKRPLKEVSEASFESENEGDLPESDDDDDVASTAGDVVAGCRRLPDASTLDCERRLQRIATTGVVQLFNAVSQHCREVQAKVKAAGGSERKKAKVLSTIDKGSFIDLLKGRRSEEKQKWPVLKEDYMMKAKMRDWGKGEEGEEGERESEATSNSDSDD